MNMPPPQMPSMDGYKPAQDDFFGDIYFDENNEINYSFGRTNDGSSSGTGNLNQVLEKLDLVIKSHDTHHQYYQRFASGSESKEKVVVEDDDDDDVANDVEMSKFKTPLSHMLSSCKDKFTSIKGRGRRIKKKSKLLKSPFQEFDSTPRDKEEEFSEQLINNLIGRKNYWVYTEYHPNVAMDSDFWKKATTGWFDTPHMSCWINKLLLERDPEADWTILPSFFLSSVKMFRTWFHDLASGQMWPFPAIEHVDIFYVPVNMDNQHWCLAVIDIPKWSMTVYDSYPEICSAERSDMLNFLDYMFTTWLAYNNYDMGPTFRYPPFERSYPISVPHQSGSVGDCGVWVCIFYRD
ncbi:hypothetical protein E3N88_35910 [Mikania micrantha]|uniref:Ubiquitin-like protease family profile domain-containing protein n=1 Tax=Mikania micrantha TaxID=192012 RepID=A0A5N6M286_9ASTR|nr:hypothetical protein E3N88_35910 [Mikania micrantha]